MLNIHRLTDGDLKLISFTNVNPIGSSFTSLHLSTGAVITLNAMRQTLGPYDMYSLEILDDAIDGDSEVAAGWRIGTITVLSRYEWLSSEQVTTDHFGSNPVIQAWGPEAPPEARPTVVAKVDFALIVTDVTKINELMIYLWDYPGITYLTQDLSEISKMREEYHKLAVLASG